jgi:hypothetical protein
MIFKCLCVHSTSNEASCILLEDKLRSYSSLVDDRSEDAVNNYAKSSLALAAHCKNGKDKRVCSVILHVLGLGHIGGSWEACSSSGGGGWQGGNSSNKW